MNRSCCGKNLHVSPTFASRGLVCPREANIAETWRFWTHHEPFMMRKKHSCFNTLVGRSKACTAIRIPARSHSIAEYAAAAGPPIAWRDRIPTSIDSLASHLRFLRHHQYFNIFNILIFYNSKILKFKNIKIFSPKNCAAPSADQFNPSSKMLYRRNTDHWSRRSRRTLPPSAPFAS